MHPLGLRAYFSVLFALPAAAAGLHDLELDTCLLTAAENLQSDRTSCANTVDGFSLLQVNAERKAAHPADVSAGTAALHEEFAASQMDEAMAKQLEDVSFGILGSNFMMFNKSASRYQPREVDDAENAVSKPGAEWFSWPAEDGSRGNMDLGRVTWVFGSYHKSGCELSRGFCFRLSGGPVHNVHQASHEIEGDPTSMFDHMAFSDRFYEPDVGIIFKIPNYRFVHMIRMPASLIISAYHWHCINDHRTEDWLFDPMEQFWCHDPTQCPGHFSRYGLLPTILDQDGALRRNVEVEHHELFHQLNRSVHDHMTLNQFYASVSQAQGVVVEAYRSLWSVNLMTDNYERTRQDSHSVQVRMESIKANFPSAMRCMFNFLQTSKDFNVEWAMEKVDSLNVQKYGTQGSSTEGWHISSHTASEDAELHEVLKSVKFVADRHQKLSRTALNDC